MAEIKAFNALRYQKKAGDIAKLLCPPYDIISEEERRDYLKTDPYNIVRLELPGNGKDPYVEAGKVLNDWLKEEIVACDKEAGIYIYEIEFDTTDGRKSIKGLNCLVRLEEFSKGIVLPHEETLSKAKEDRFKLYKATSCNFSSIYSLYVDENKNIYPLIENLSLGEPDRSVTLKDGTTHRLWCIYDKKMIQTLASAFEKQKLYIADGHHRYETALNYRNYLREQGQTTDGADYVLMMLVNLEHPGLVVLPTHRIVYGINDFNGDKLLEAGKAYFDISAIEKTQIAEHLDNTLKQGKKALVCYYDGKAFLLELSDDNIMTELLPESSLAIRKLDVSILHTLILERLLGIDKENLAKQKNLIYTRDIEEAITAVDNKAADCAFLINPTGVEEIIAVSIAGEKMPQKSTYFYPKLITGLVMNKIK